MNRCFIIPIYNHYQTIAETVAGLRSYGHPIIIVDDGSNTTTKEVLHQLSASEPLVQLEENPVNLGKGGAVMTGMLAAAKRNYTHALQVDADGQHDLSDVEAMWQLAEEHPHALISGQPIYDHTVPKGRLIGRYITHIWVWIETLSLDIRDTMCGFRVYPLAPCIQLLKKKKPGARMDFDIEIMVRLYWQGVKVIFHPTRVIYPDNGVSHFQAFRDNVRISWLHTRLFFGMLLRAPVLIYRRRVRSYG